MTMSVKASFVSFLNKKYPELGLDKLTELVSDNLISPFQIELSNEEIEHLKNEIKKYWQLRQWTEKNKVSEYVKMGLKKPNNYSVCMSYDFHINAEGQPELIEINTNAAFLAMGLQIYEYFNLPNIAGSFNERALVEMFKKEMQLAGAKTNSIAIIDEKPELQRLYIEFLVYQQIFKSEGVESAIFNYDQIEMFKNFGLIYNRYTDFFLNQNESLQLKELFNSKLNLSPNPYEYFLLADKQRLLDWNTQTEVNKPTSLLKIFDLATADKEEIWQNRKNLFIKPKNSFGSKQAYRGSSISRRLFDEIYGADFVAQQLSTPSEVEVIYNEKPEKFKYDLRCYVYQDQLQLMIARLYQGQTTNLKTAGGGFAAVKLKN
jgi:hypothetical protein